MSARVSTRSKWAVLAESDSDSDTEKIVTPVTKKSVTWADGVSFPKIDVSVSAETRVVVVKEKIAVPDIDAVLAAMASGERSWADIMDEIMGVPVSPVGVTVGPRQRRLNSWDDFWALPFAGRLQELWGDCYDCSSLSEAEWNDMMRWLHEAGWDVGQCDRNGVEFEEANGPSRSWIPPAELAAMLEEEAALRSHRPRHCHSHPTEKPKVVEAQSAPAKAKTVVVVPRFCREGTSCAKEGCRYVHADTIPRVNKPCGFGESCGKGDAAKRAMCLYMHPGEVWAEGMVIHRPAE